MSEIRRAERIHQLMPDEGMIGDISETGLCLRPSGPLSVLPKSEVRIELTSAGRTLVFEARVIYIRPAGKEQTIAGFEFLRMTPEKRSQVAEMVDSYSRGVPIRAHVVK